MPSKYWFQSKKSYDHLSMITRDLDQIISPFILQSLVENLIYICMDIVYFDNNSFYSYVNVLNKVKCIT